MVSYEKIRQSLRSWTLFLAWLNVVASVLKLLSIGSYFFISSDPDQLRATLDSQSYDAIIASNNICTILLYIFGLVANITIAVLAFKNLKPLKERDSFPSQVPYLIGIVYTVVFNLINIIESFVVGLEINLFFALLPALICLAMYANVYRLTGKLQTQDDKEEVKEVEEE